MKRILFWLSLAVCATLACLAQDAGPPPAGQATQEKTPTIRVDVKLVNVFTTVVDELGAPVATLRREDFQVLEDGVPQNVAVFDRESELPLSIVLAIDTSLSTRKDIKLELESARRFVRSILRPVDALALYQFSDRVDELVAFTADLKRIDRGIARARVGAATALFDAVFLGGRALEPRTGRKVLVVITDGADTGSVVKYAEAVRSAQQAEAIVYSIIVVPIASSAGRNLGGEHALIQISRDTGGRHFYSQSIAQLDEALQRVSEELRTQYLVAYYPKRRLSSSEFRRIEVKVRGMRPAEPPPDLPPDEEPSGYRVRHRSGYYTSKAE